MPQPNLTRFAQELYDALAPVAFADERYGWPLAHLCAAVAKPHDFFDDLSLETPGHPGWSTILDVDECPVGWLPWLAQFQGVQITVDAAPEFQRQEIREAKGMKRGTPASIVSAAGLHLTGNKTVVLRERYGSAYHFMLITRTSETADAAALVREVNKVKPAGLTWEHVVAAGQTWDEATGTWDAAGATTWDDTNTVMV